MKTVLAGGALALLGLHASVAQARNADRHPLPEDDGADASAIVVSSPLLHPSAGLMNDHMHEDGEAMIGLRFERRRYSGANISGTDTISDEAILAAGYSVRARSMEMDMVMLDLMYAPSQKVTLMLMPHYMWHRMEMVGIDPMAGADMGGMDMTMSADQSGHAAMLPYGAVHAHGTEGFGDALVSASYRLARSDPFNAHATLGLWLPTGSVEKKNPDGTYVHYGMQPGSGTWDIEPSLTVSGRKGDFGWGAQGLYRWRALDRNDAGFAFGDKAQVSGWASYRMAPSLGTTARVEYVHEGPVEGHYDGPHKHASAADLQGNYGGDTVSLGLGLNWFMPVGRRSPQLSAELALPVHQDLGGIQLPQDWRLSVGISQTF